MLTPSWQMGKNVIIHTNLTHFKAQWGSGTQGMLENHTESIQK